jgi:tetratricopeptide (TPR) repeat protein
VKTPILITLFLLTICQVATASHSEGNYGYLDIPLNAESIKTFSEHLEIDSGVVDYFINQGLDRYNKGDFDRAIANYNKALEINPRYAEIYINRGLAWKKKGEYEKAINDYHRALEINPNLCMAYNDRGRVWDELGANLTRPLMITIKLSI